MRLSWKQPPEDGGAGVLGYLVLARSTNDTTGAVDTDWFVVYNETVAAQQLSAIHKDLITTSIYTYSLHAVNRVGVSAPLQQSVRLAEFIGASGSYAAVLPDRLRSGFEQSSRGLQSRICKNRN